MAAVLATLLGALMWVCPLYGQATPTFSGAAIDEPPRPRLIGVLSDTNAAESYLEYGRMVMASDPARAADAFYWASRLDPSAASPLMLRWQALWMAQPKRFKKYLEGDTKVITSPEARRIDSLHYRALLRDPFIFTQRESGAFFVPSIADVRRAMNRHPEDVGLRIFQAGNFYAAKQYDSTVAQLTQAIDMLRTRERQSVSPVYISKEIFEYAIARALTSKGDLNGARAAFERALSENLSFSPAHVGVGTIAWSNWQDVGTAAQEFELAIQLAPSDGLVRYQFGRVLADAARREEAVVQLGRAIELEPHFADSYFILATVLEAQSKPAEAATRYRQFLDRAPPQRIDWAASARARLATLAAK